jgi:hypothetical protein
VNTPFPYDIIYIVVMCVFLYAVDAHLVYLPMLAAILAYYTTYDIVQAGLAAFTVATFFSLVAKLVRSGREKGS